MGAFIRAASQQDERSDGITETLPADLTLASLDVTRTDHRWALPIRVNRKE